MLFGIDVLACSCGTTVGVEEAVGCPDIVGFGILDREFIDVRRPASCVPCIPELVPIDGRAGTSPAGTPGRPLEAGRGCPVLPIGLGCKLPGERESSVLS